MNCDNCPANLNICVGGYKGDYFCNRFLEKLEDYIAKKIKEDKEKG